MQGQKLSDFEEQILLRHNQANQGTLFTKEDIEMLKRGIAPMRTMHIADKVIKTFHDSMKEPLPRGEAISVFLQKGEFMKFNAAAFAPTLMMVKTLDVALSLLYEKGILTKEEVAARFDEVHAMPAQGTPSSEEAAAPDATESQEPTPRIN